MPQPTTIQVMSVVANHSLTFSNASIAGMMGKGEECKYIRGGGGVNLYNGQG